MEDSCVLRERGSLRAEVDASECLARSSSGTIAGGVEPDTAQVLWGGPWL